MENLTADNATHYLYCSHVCGNNEKHFKMKCHVLKNMNDGRYKVLVFGRLYWKNTDHLSRVRYVDASRVHAITIT